MHHIPKIVIWKNCDSFISKEILRFESLWRPYSTASRRYHLTSLIEKIIDPALKEYLNRIPEKYSYFTYPLGLSHRIRAVGFDEMVLLQRHLLRHFVLTEDKGSHTDIQFIGSMESLISLIWDCACKRSQKSTITSGVNLNANRRRSLCAFCGEPTELSAFMEIASNKKTNDIELENHKKLELSHNFCTGHRPKFMNGNWNPAYKTAKRSSTQFELELGRILRQCAKRNKPDIASTGSPLANKYFFKYFSDHQELEAADKAKLRNLARMMVDSRLSDRKKEILALQASGYSQSEIARELGINRQVVSIALATIPAALQLRCQKNFSR